MQGFLEKLGEYGAQAGVRLLGGLAVILIGFKLVNMLTKYLKADNRLVKVDANAKTFVVSFISVALKGLLLITAANIFGVPMTSIVAVLGSAGLAVGLALQGSLSNLAGGLMILVFHPFMAGDYISAAGYEGTVHSISLLYTRMLTVDNRSIMVPNGTLSNTAVTNYTREKQRRVDLDITVGYDTDIDSVETMLLALTERHAKVLKTPAPVCRLKEHGESALVFTLRCWTENEDYWTVRFDLLEQSKKLFDQAGISIPFPQMDVHIASGDARQGK